MFRNSEYITRGYNFMHNHMFPMHKRVSSLMVYATDLCDSGCKHCLIWAKRPVTHLSMENIEKIMKSKCIHPSTSVGLEGGEFLLHPQADEILKWFSDHHPNFDLFSNCLKPENLIHSVEKYKPHRLYISLDGNESTYLHMRGKDGYASVLHVIENLKNKVPVFVMFTLSPYNDFNDLAHVAEVCKKNNVFLRVGIYNNIPFFDTIENAKQSFVGQYKNDEVLTYSKVKELREDKNTVESTSSEKKSRAINDNDAFNIPETIKEFKENYDYIKLYKNWLSGNLRLKCNSILDSVIILPDGSVPICQNLSIKLGNIFENSLDNIFNSAHTKELHHHYSNNCNQCWISYHRKYDIVLYRTFEKYFGKRATAKILGYYKWDWNDQLSLKETIGR